MLSYCGSQRSELGSREYQAVSGQAPGRGQLASAACGSLPMGWYVPLGFRDSFALTIFRTPDIRVFVLPLMGWQRVPTHYYSYSCRYSHRCINPFHPSLSLIHVPDP